MYFVGVNIGKRKHVAAIIDNSGCIIKEAFTFNDGLSGYKKMSKELCNISVNPLDFIIGLKCTPYDGSALYSKLRDDGYTVYLIAAKDRMT